MTKPQRGAATALHQGQHELFLNPREGINLWLSFGVKREHKASYQLTTESEYDKLNIWLIVQFRVATRAGRKKLLFLDKQRATVFLARPSLLVTVECLWLKF